MAAVSASGVHAADSETGEVANPKDKIVCKTQRFVGSNIPSRVCKTKGEWEQARIDAKRSLNKPHEGRGAARSSERQRASKFFRTGWIFRQLTPTYLGTFPVVSTQRSTSG
jgi:hypothetical protein